MKPTPRYLAIILERGRPNRAEGFALFGDANRSVLNAVVKKSAMGLVVTTGNYEVAAGYMLEPGRRARGMSEDEQREATAELLHSTQLGQLVEHARSMGRMVDTARQNIKRVTGQARSLQKKQSACEQEQCAEGFSFEIVCPDGKVRDMPHLNHGDAQSMAEMYDRSGHKGERACRGRGHHVREVGQSETPEPRDVLLLQWRPYAGPRAPWRGMRLTIKKPPSRFLQDELRAHAYIWQERDGMWNGFYERLTPGEITDVPLRPMRDEKSAKAQARATMLADDSVFSSAG